MFDVFGLGHCCIDHLSILEPYPEKGKKGVVVESCLTGGGPVPTALRLVTRFGGTATFCGKVGDDDAGRQIISELRDDNIDTRQLVVDPQTTTARADIWIDPADGRRTIALKIPANPWISADQIDVELVTNCRIFFTDGREREASIKGLRSAREAGITTVFDTGSSRPGLYDMLPLIDYAIVSQDLFEHIESEEMSLRKGSDMQVDRSRKLADHLIKAGAKAVIVTLGERGALWHDGTQIRILVGFPVKAIDTTGAGDVFHGAFIHGLLQNWEVSSIIEFANAAAAASCRRLSGSGGIPTLEEVGVLIEG